MTHLRYSRIQIHSTHAFANPSWRFWSHCWAKRSGGCATKITLFTYLYDQSGLIDGLSLAIDMKVCHRDVQLIVMFEVCGKIGPQSLDLQGLGFYVWPWKRKKKLGNSEINGVFLCISSDTRSRNDFRHYFYEKPMVRRLLGIYSLFW